MKSFAGILVAVAIVALLVGLWFLRRKLMRGAQVKRSRHERAAREAERDRHAVRQARQSMAFAHGAPQGAFTIPGSAAGAPAAGSPIESLQNSMDRRRRAATSTDFDPDLPGS